MTPKTPPWSLASLNRFPPEFPLATETGSNVDRDSFESAPLANFRIDVRGKRESLITDVFSRRRKETGSNVGRDLLRQGLESKELKRGASHRPPPVRQQAPPTHAATRLMGALRVVRGSFLLTTGRPRAALDTERQH